MRYLITCQRRGKSPGQFASPDVSVVIQSMPPELSRIYSRRFEQNVVYRNQVWQVLTSQFFQRWIPRESSVLDLGCGYGEFINNIEAREKLGIDMNPDAPSRLRRDVRFMQQDTLPAMWPLPDASLEHRLYEQLL